MPIIIAIIGIIIGGYLGLYIPMIFCFIFDTLNPPSGAGGGLGAVGWIACIFTIPISAIVTPIILVGLYSKRVKRLEEQKLQAYVQTVDKENNRIDRTSGSTE